MDKIVCPSCYTKSANLAQAKPCEHCGYLDTNLNTESAERSTLDDLHKKIAESDDAGKIRLLGNSFLPDNARDLIEAGLYCLPLTENGIAAVQKAAASRLRAIITKLQILGDSDPKTQTALQEFEQKLNRYDQSTQRENGIIAIVVMVVCVLLIGALVWLGNALLGNMAAGLILFL